MTALPSALAIQASRPARSDFPLRLDREVDDRRRPAEGRGARAGLERVLRERPAEGQLHVRVDVDAARDHVLAGRVDGLVGGHAMARQVGADRGDPLAVDEDVRADRTRRP